MKAFRSLFLIFLFCAAGQAFAKYSGALTPGQWIRTSISSADSDSVPVQIYIPKNFSPAENRAIILLHSYGKNPSEWEKLSGAVKQAEAFKVALVCPDMGKTTYESGYFDETTRKWNAVPGGKWIPTVLVPWLRSEFSLCTRREYTGIAGVEMGARGALLAAARNSEIFGFAAGIAGLYDPSSLTSGEPFAAIYGPYKDNKDRWENTDSIVSLAPKLADTVVFMYHGKRDKVSPIDQSYLMVIRLSQLHKKNPGKFRFRFMDRAIGDGWDIWQYAIPELFGDFASLKPKEPK